MNSSKTTKIAICAVAIMALAMMACIAPALADTWSITTASDKTTYVQGALVTISGTLTDVTTSTPGAGLLVSVQVTDSAGNLAYSNIVTTNATGKYVTSFSYPTGPAGTYQISAVASQNGLQIASAIGSFSVTLAVPVVQSITLSPSTGFATTISGSGFTPSDTVSIKWVNTVMSTLPSPVTDRKSVV